MKKYTQLNTRNRKYPTVQKVGPVTLRVKKGDTVKVLTGKDKGKSGTVLRAYPKKRTIIVEGVNVHKRHTRRVGNQSGRIIEKSLPVDASNVAKVSK
jgi:large subunit ribosomal protein L24